MNNPKEKNCPYLDVIIAIGSREKSGCFCRLFYDEKRCIFDPGYPDAGECSYYLFPEFKGENESIDQFLTRMNNKEKEVGDKNT